MSDCINGSSILVASKNQVAADLSSEALESIVILSLKDGKYYELKEVAARVWALIQEPCSVRDILDKLLEEYEVDAGQCEADLITLAEDLFQRGLVEVQ